MKLVLFVMAVTALALLAVAGVGNAVLVFDTGCIKEVYKTEHTRLEVPMVDGHPDYKHGLASGVGMKIDSTCAHYEIRKDDKK